MTRRPQKRRRLSTASTSTAGTTESSRTAVPFTSPPPDRWHAQDGIDSASVGGHSEAEHKSNRGLSCVSCHRSLVVAEGKQSQVVYCPRCHAPSCSICSRRCTALPPSMPPTPTLSYTPTPPGSPALSPEPLSGAIVDDTPHARTHAYVQAQPFPGLDDVQSSRRRRARDDEDDESTVVGGDDGEFDRKSVAPGCSRLMCQNCSIESSQTGFTTCYDCYGLPPPRASYA